MTDVFKLIEANGLTLHGDIEHFAELVRADERDKRERNFCPRCGKRTADLTVIHTCTPPT
jgi:hypothetical protein